MDAVGNWSSFTNDGSTQTRTSNLQNQITAISGATTPTYDNNGNTTTDTANTYIYDAWNRTVKAVTGSGIVGYAYDALGRRSTRTYSLTSDFYYSSSWQVIEEDYGGTVSALYVWSPLYVDGLVTSNFSSNWYSVQQDANWNVTAVVRVANPVFPSVSVYERYAYDPYGKPSFYNASWNPVSGTTLVYLFQGGRYDTITGLYNFRNRDYSPTLGRWMQQDPVGYAGADRNLYGFVRENPVNATDPKGLDRIAIYSRPTAGPGINILGIIYTPHWFVGVTKDDGTIVTYSWDGAWHKSDQILDIPYVTWWHKVSGIVVSPKVTAEEVERAYQQVKPAVGPLTCGDCCSNRALQLLWDASKLAGERLTVYNTNGIIHYNPDGTTDSVFIPVGR